MGMEVFPDAASLARAAAEHVTSVATEAVARRGCFHVALAGGSTPRPTYALLTEEPFAGRVDWTRTHVFWGDERAVPPDRPDSNYRMARQVLLDRVPVPSQNVHRIPGELPAHRAALAYQTELEKVLGGSGRFDLILLGMGVDGHTASLFPGAAALDEQDRRVVASYVERLGAWRITLTLPVINAARWVTFLVSGAGKAEALARVRAGDPLPAGRVAPTDGRLTWLVDREAAGPGPGEQ